MKVKELVLIEADFDIERKAEGQVRFPVSSMNDPFVKKTIMAIARHTGKSLQAVTAEIEEKMNEFSGIAEKSPILYETINKNAAEQQAFTQFWKEGVPVKDTPKFSNITFNKLVRRLRIEYDEFFPLRSYIDRRHLINPIIKVLEPGTAEAEKLSTAAATPGGVFLFNEQFMQQLMNYSKLKDVKPKGAKFKSNGGDFPDEYAYIEFVIMHEFMHYSNDDFYYQKIIPKANPKIINWVGDFRTNYLLTKSGFEALPMGLFNDKINYDRQREYVEMYRIVEEEFENLKSDEQRALEELLDQLSDDHSQGNQEGEESDVTEEDATPGELDDAAGENEEAVEGGGEGGGEEGDKGGQGRSDSEDGEPGSGDRNPRDYSVDYENVEPRFNWKTLMSRFIKTGLAKTEPTYSRPHRRSITTMDVARQTGAGAIKPADRPVDYSDAKLMYIIDNSGSMTGIINTVIANAMKLLNQPAFKKATILALKFSNKADLYKVSIPRNVAGLIINPNDTPEKWDKSAREVLGSHMGGGTDISSSMVVTVNKATSENYNVVLFTDGDVMWGGNYDNVLKMIKSAPGLMFIVFDRKDTYVAFRQKSGINTPNMTYFN